jgi:hypothetical protein
MSVSEILNLSYYNASNCDPSTMYETAKYVLQCSTQRFNHSQVYIKNSNAFNVYLSPNSQGSSKNGACSPKLPTDLVTLAPNECKLFNTSQNLKALYFSANGGHRLTVTEWSLMTSVMSMFVGILVATPCLLAGIDAVGI